MKKVFYLLIAIVALASCTTEKPLYTWENYSATSYNYLKNSDEKSAQQLIESYKKIIDKQKGSRKVVPPGVYADYGFLLIKMKKTAEGKKLLMQEVALYPESKVFIDRILKMLE